MITISVNDLKHLLGEKGQLANKSVKLSAKDVASLLGIKQSSVYVYLRRKGLKFNDRNSKAIVQVLKERIN